MNIPERARALYNRPLALLPSQFEMAAYGAPQETLPQADLINRVAVIPIRGSLCNDYCWYGASYADIRVGFLAALGAADVDAIVLDIDSPGGTVDGCFDLADTIYDARGFKPIVAILSESAYSAAYALASAADIITVPRTGGTGSVGVIAMHLDLSGMLEKAGLGVTLITFGDRKAEANPYGPLGKDALKRLQADVDTTGELFVDTVARNRGMKASAVRATQAGTFQGAAGVEIGFADAVLAPDAAFRALLDRLD